LEIGQNRNRTALLLCQAPHQLDPPGVVLVLSMGEIDPGDSHARLQKGA
jgi:hypothetical protein